MAGKIKNAVATKQNGAVSKPKTMKDYVQQMLDAGELAKALPSVITPERFTRIVLSALSSTPELNNCSRESFLGAMMTSAQLGLEPNTPLGQAYLIPFRNNRKGVVECQFQLGYKGLIDLAYRSGVKSIQVHEVYENDVFTCEYGLEPKLVHKPALTDRGRVIAYYAVFETAEGGTGFEIMSREDVEAHAKKYSKSFGSGPWKTDFDAMAKKTVLKRVLKYAPLRTDFVRAVESDESVREIDEDATSDAMDWGTTTFVKAEYEVQEDEPLDPFDGVDGDLAEGEIPQPKDYAADEPEFMKE
jgi:recombination protein RecT